MSHGLENRVPTIYKPFYPQGVLCFTSYLFMSLCHVLLRIHKANNSLEPAFHASCDKVSVKTQLDQLLQTKHIRVLLIQIVLYI